MVTTQPGSAYNNSTFVLGDDGNASTIWPISIIEYLVVELLWFSVAARDGTVGVASLDLRIGGNGQGVLVSWPLSVLRESVDIRILEFICDSGIDPVV